MSEYNSVVQAVDVIRSFLNTHESSSATCFWESNIDGTVLKTDWGYFEDGLDEIRDYCERLDVDRKDEPQNQDKPPLVKDLVKDIVESGWCSKCKHLLDDECDCDIVFTGFTPKDEPQTESEGG